MSRTMYQCAVQAISVALLFLCFEAQSAVASSSIRGFISIQDSKIFLRPLALGTGGAAHGEPLTVTPLPITTSIGIRTALLDLKNDDFVVVSGSLVDLDHDLKFDEVVIHAIESVGLNAILGTWRDAKWGLVRFEDFTSMSVYRPRFQFKAELSSRFQPRISPRSERKFAKLKDLNYTLAPGPGSTYSIFLVEKVSGRGRAAVYIGRLSLSPKGAKSGLTLEIFDPRSGTASEVLSLSPVQD